MERNLSQTKRSWSKATNGCESPAATMDYRRTYHHSSTDRGNDLRSRARIRLVGSELAVKVDLIRVSATGLSRFLFFEAHKRFYFGCMVLQLRLGESCYVKRLSESLVPQKMLPRSSHRSADHHSDSQSLHWAHVVSQPGCVVDGATGDLMPVLQYPIRTKLVHFSGQCFAAPTIGSQSHAVDDLSHLRAGALSNCWSDGD